jgi:hypothetical protein
MRFRIFAILVCAAWAVLVRARTARGDTRGPDAREPRSRPCCAFAVDMSVDLGAARAPIVLRGVLPKSGLGWHSYLPDGELTENNGLVYTRRGGFIDLGHARDNADIAAHLALQLRPLLARGSGVLELGPKGADRRLVVTESVPADELRSTSNRIAVRVAFDLSIWTELVQYYGLSKYRGAGEVYSAFTPDDLYSNLLGAHLGTMALESPEPYDRAMDVALAATLDALGAESSAATLATMYALDGRWWNHDRSWPSPDIAILRVYNIGPRVPPMLAPADVVPPPPDPLVLDVPQTDEHGAPLSRHYRLEIVPHADEMSRFPRDERGATLGEEDIPRLVVAVHRALDAHAASRHPSEFDLPPDVGIRGEVAHYVASVRLLELSGAGGVQDRKGGHFDGVGGGRLGLVHGDTRGGDFSLVNLDVGYAPVRGVIAATSIFRADALWFCHDPDTGSLRAPVLSALGPCAPGEWFGVGGSIAEAVHDGDSGRTALRPISLAGILNPLRNGQSASYDVVRLLLRMEGEVEHVWTVQEGPRTVPRAGGSLSFLARTPSLRLETRAAGGYRYDLARARDGVVESDVAVAYNLLLSRGVNGGAHQRSDAWGLFQVGLEGSYSYWVHPSNAFPEIAAPFVSTEHPETLQVLLTARLGFEAFAF